MSFSVGEGNSVTCYLCWWSRRESNPGPNKSAVCLLHAYLMINCREQTGQQQTNLFLSWISLKLQSQPFATAFRFLFKSAAARGNRQTWTAARMTN